MKNRPNSMINKDEFKLWNAVMDKRADKFHGIICKKCQYWDKGGNCCGYVLRTPSCKWCTSFKCIALGYFSPIDDGINPAKVERMLYEEIAKTIEGRSELERLFERVAGWTHGSVRNGRLPESYYVSRQTDDAEK